MVTLLNALIITNSALTPFAFVVAIAYVGWQVKRIADCVELWSNQDAPTLPPDHR